MQNELIGVFNTLCTINVKGQDAITMAQALIALRDIIEKSGGTEQNDND